MSFKVGLECGNGVHISDIWGEGIPKVGGGAAESSCPHSGEIGGGDLQFDGGGRPEGRVGGINMNEVR